VPLGAEDVGGGDAGRTAGRALSDMNA